MPRENISPSDDLVEVIRQVNAMELSDISRGNVLAHISESVSHNHIVLSKYDKTNESPLSIFKALSAENSGQTNLLRKLIADCST